MLNATAALMSSAAAMTGAGDTPPGFSLVQLLTGAQQRCDGDDERSAHGAQQLARAAMEEESARVSTRQRVHVSIRSPSPPHGIVA
jgi:hypothetical protein